jgi:DNA mismatch repair ATPase MutS
MAALGLLALPAAFYLGGWGVLLLVATFAANGLRHQRLRARCEPEIQALRHLGAILAAAGDLARQAVPGLHEETSGLEQCCRAARPIARGIATFFTGAPADLLYEYLNIQLLLEARGFQKAMRALPKALPALRHAFVAVGELDAWQAVASFREGQSYCTPTFADGRVVLEVEDLVHPLVDQPVPNSITLATRGALITGANMSGKSTLLRALGVNTLLAQTIHTCFARRYLTSRFRVLSCLRTADDLLGGKSLYWAEAERLLEIVRALDGGQPALCLIDELLAGTNSTERLAASIAILGFMSRKRALLVSATHDLELAWPLRQALDGYHFTYHASEDGIRFDYRLRAGVDSARNAIRLLGLLGFPAEIVAAATERLGRV